MNIQENKELLLKDLCARLPYGVKMTDGVDIYRLTSPFLYKYIEMELKPYLRPMSSMTEEERKTYAKLLFADLGGVYEDYYKALDYLNLNYAFY